MQNIPIILKGKQCLKEGKRIGNTKFGSRYFGSK